METTDPSLKTDAMMRKAITPQVHTFIARFAVWSVIQHARRSFSRAECQTGRMTYACNRTGKAESARMPSLLCQRNLPAGTARCMSGKHAIKRSIATAASNRAS